MTLWCDVGVNLFSEQFAADRPLVLERATAAGVKHLLLIGSDLAESEQNLQFCLQQAQQQTSLSLVTTAGVHPHYAAQVTDNWLQQLTQLLSADSVVAIGECGLDFNRDFSPRPQQQQVFAEQLQLAVQYNKAVYLHERDAFDTQIAMLKQHNIQHGVAHCFTGNVQQLRAYLDLGLYIGITGWVCDDKRGAELQQAIAYIPNDRLLLETDAPFLMPKNIQPKPNSRRNEPAYISYVAEKVAELKHCSVSDISTLTWQNSQRLFGFMPRPEHD
ncbi:TatD family hydrolase [Rheinheimera salexigens]|uniref:Hydrolase TatD n=1 Tax=Rheinheimera salexigens TaxID=1628148 RepID=A0A1E7Q293_9GAMM|nr:TatD family hydrolase [Rheinheimera salexigens]OEY68236.1 hydrolase TatD [Rheinheimera salexigens]